MDQVHVVRHKVLVEGRSQRAVAREQGLARVTVRKYLDQAVPARRAAVRLRPVWDAVAERMQALLAGAVDARQTAADRYAARVAGDRGAPPRRDSGQRRGRGTEAAVSLIRFSGRCRCGDRSS